MSPFIHLGLMVTTILASGALSLAAETTVALDATTTAIVGTTTSGDLVVKNTSYSILPVPLTAAEVAAVNSKIGDNDGSAPGPYVGWTVISADKQPLGKITYSMQDKDGKISTFNMVLPDGHGIRVANGIAAMGDGTLELRLTQAEVLANAASGFSSITMQ